MTSYSERTNILNEIYETEKNYNEQLNLLDLVYAKGIRESLNSKNSLMDSVTYSLIFGEIDIIRKINKELFSSLEKIREEEKNKKKVTKTIGEIFIEFIPVFKNYTNYCQSYDKIIKKLEELKKKNIFDNYLYDKKTSIENTTNFTIESYLILPIQRIPRYELLLKDLLKHTSKYHRDYESLLKSVSEMKSLAEYVNTNLKYFQSMEKLKDIIKDIKDIPKDLSFQNKKLEKELNVIYKEFDEEIEVFLYLMNDMLLLVKKKNKQFYYFKHLIFNQTPLFWILDKENDLFDIISKDDVWTLIIKEKLDFFKILLPLLDDLVKKNPDLLKQRATYQVKKKPITNHSITQKITKIFNTEDSLLYPKKREQLIIDKSTLTSFQIPLEYSKNIVYSIMDYPNFNNTLEDEIKYKEGDLFIILEKNIKNSNIQWCFVYKVGMNFSKFEYSYDILCNLMKDKGKDKIISNLLKDLNMKPPQKKDFLHLISLPELPKMEMSFEKLENCFEEKGQCGVIPMKCIKEVKEVDEFIKKFQERDEMEEKKLRNFKVKKKDSYIQTTEIKIIPEKKSRKSLFEFIANK